MSNVEIEIVLNELLEEQRKETLANGEMITILKELLEKTGAIVNQFQPGDTPTISERIRAIQLCCNGREDTAAPVKNQEVFMPAPVLQLGTTIKYSYHLKAVIAAVLFFLLSIVLTIKYYSNDNELTRYKKSIPGYQVANLKYSFIKTNLNNTLQKILRQVDSFYNAAPAVMLDSVLQSEKRRIK